MPKLPRLSASEAERRLFAAGFVLMRSKGSHRITFVAVTASSSLFIAGKSCIRKLCAKCCRQPAKSEEFAVKHVRENR